MDKCPKCGYKPPRKCHRCGHMFEGIGDVMENLREEMEHDVYAHHIVWHQDMLERLARRKGV